MNRDKKKSPSSPIDMIVDINDKSFNLRRIRSNPNTYVQPAFESKNIDYTEPSRRVNNSYLQKPANLSFFSQLSQDKKTYFSEISSNIPSSQILGNIFSKVGDVPDNEIEEEKKKLTNFTTLVQHIGMDDLKDDGDDDWIVVRQKRSRLSKRKEKKKRKKEEIKKLNRKVDQVIHEQLKKKINEENKSVIVEIKKKSKKEEIVRELQEKTFVHIVKDWNIKGSNYYVLRTKLHEEELKRKATNQKQIKDAEIKILANKKKRLEKRVRPGYLKKLKRHKEKKLKQINIKEKNEQNKVLTEEIKDIVEKDVMTIAVVEKTYANIVKDWNIKGSNFHVLQRRLLDEEKNKIMKKQEKLKYAELKKLEIKKQRLPKRVSPAYLKKVKRDKEKKINYGIIEDKRKQDMLKEIEMSKAQEMLGKKIPVGKCIHRIVKRRKLNVQSIK